jgi:hypothetical protein
MAVSDEFNASIWPRADRRRGMAFLIEALIVLGFLMFALAVFVQLFSRAQIEGLKSNQLSEAVLVATNCAEEFSAHPQGAEGTTTKGDFEVVCTVTPVKRAGGVLYEATIQVLSNSTQVFELRTSRYVSANRGGDVA